MTLYTKQEHLKKPSINSFFEEIEIRRNIRRQIGNTALLSIHH